ncbi:MAG TPA: D-glycerate dehydrogenase [Gaiellaceae bacterium]|nr:D-glycerate dehydrogenase [Gaiellaceae bacterium]
MPPVVAVTRRVVPSVRDELGRRFDLRIHDSEQPALRDELVALVAGADGLLTMLTDAVDAELLDAAGPQLRVVANHATGHDNVDLAAARERGVTVTTTPGVLERATAEHTIALLLALTRRVAEGDRFLRRGEPWAWAPTFMLGHGLAGRTLGLVGLGRIGAEVARLAAALGLEVVYTARTPRDVPYPRLPLGELLAGADAVSLHVPLTDETRGLIGAEELGLMRPGAVLVNTARGPIVDEAALAGALRAGEIAGAALDVFEHEPAVHPGLLELENVVLTPHTASATHEAREAMGRLCVEALTAVLLDGRTPDTAV